MPTVVWVGTSGLVAFVAGWYASAASSPVGGDPFVATFAGLGAITAWALAVEVAAIAYVRGWPGLVRSLSFAWRRMSGPQERILSALEAALEVGTPQEIQACLDEWQDDGHGGFAEVWAHARRERLLGNPARAIATYMGAVDELEGVDRAECFFEASLAAVQRPDVVVVNLGRPYDQANRWVSLGFEALQVGGDDEDGVRSDYVQTLGLCVAHMLETSQGMDLRTSRTGLRRLRSRLRSIQSLRSRRIAEILIVEELVMLMRGSNATVSERAIRVRRKVRLRSVIQRLDEVFTVGKAGGYAAKGSETGRLREAGVVS